MLGKRRAGGVAPYRHFLRLPEGQKHRRGQVHEPALHPVLVGPEDGLDLRGVDGEGPQHGAHRRRLGVGQDGGGKFCFGVAQPRHLAVQVAGTLHQHKPGIGPIQRPAQVEGRRRGQVAHPEKCRLLHFPFSSRQDR